MDLLCANDDHPTNLTAVLVHDGASDGCITSTTELTLIAGYTSLNESQLRSPQQKKLNTD